MNNLKLNEEKNSDLEELNQEEETDTSSTTEERTTKPTNSTLEWYVLRVQSGREDKVKASLESRIELMNLKDKISQVIVPTEKVTETRKNYKRVIERKIYPGYVMIHMTKDEHTHYIVRSVPGVGNFAGTLTEDEVNKMLETCRHSHDKPRPKVTFYIGQTVKIKEGAFENYEGIVDEVNEDKAIIKVRIGIFGRFTQVELKYWQIENPEV
ncbi:MAG TPA: transcription termination/antitermination protein NusG [Planctomycetota bacterium]|nr:transcription termination/antitermination protein NusG [Planctomycetota bacterium]